MEKKVAVIGISYVPNGRMISFITKLQHSMRDSSVRFFTCGPSGWELYQQILKLKVDKIIVVDQFSDEESESQSLNYVTINEQILIIGINPLFFSTTPLSTELQQQLEQNIFRIKRLILREITLDSII